MVVRLSLWVAADCARALDENTETNGAMHRDARPLVQAILSVGVLALDATAGSSASGSEVLAEDHPLRAAVATAKPLHLSARGIGPGWTKDEPSLELASRQVDGSVSHW